ncbi:MAG TPA: EamA family transporter [Methanothermobacter sp.]|nr:EamA family transporter [Methanothermobacter sp.]
MFWLIFAWLTALFESFTDVASKKSLKNVDMYLTAFFIRFSAFLFLIPVLFLVIFLWGVPTIGPQFWVALLIGGSLNVLTTVLYMKALKHSDLSISVPMLAFTPLFLLVTSPLIVGEFPTTLGLVGIILIVMGSYILNINEFKKGYLAPFKALLQEKGPKLMLIVAFIWSITSNYDKIGAVNSSPIIWVVAVNLFIAISIFPILLTSNKDYFQKKRSSLVKDGSYWELIKANKNILLLTGFLSALTIIFQIYAITLTLVAYVIAIKRTSVCFGVIWGHLIFHEKGVKERLTGAVVMVLGVVLIILS